MSYLFPLAFMANMFAMTVLLIVLGLTGNSALAAEVGIVQGATLALFYAFSANARSLILSQSATVPASAILIGRVLMVIPLALLSYWLSVSIAGVGQALAIVLIIRRAVEWLSEVHLSEMERLDNRPFAIKYFLAQSLLLIFAIGWLLANFTFPYLGLIVWAILPLAFSFKFIGNCFVSLPSISKRLLLKILPHFGSSAIIGVGVYVFRLLILLLVGKEVAGDLYTAFAIGGLTGSVFANALGASIALHEQRSGKRNLPSLVRIGLNFSLLFGLLIFIASMLQLPILSWTGKSYFFWQATGLSLIGGVVMVYAQRIRFRLLQQDEERDVYGADVMMNVLLITSIPFVYYLLGIQSMGALYLLSALLALIFYKSEQIGGGVEPQSIYSHDKTKMFIAGVLLLPLFFQLSNGIFRDPSMNFNSGAMLHMLPIPISVIACFGGILMLAAYRFASISLSYVFFTCLLMVVTTIAASEGVNAKEQAKLILLIQFILPMFGFVLGQMYQAKSRLASFSMEKAFLYVLAFIVPLQLLCTWLQGYKFLSPYLYGFSIYQHLQYVPVIFVSAFLVAFCCLWQSPAYKKVLFILAPLMGVYAAASMSMLAIFMILIGLMGFALYQWRHFFDKILALMLILVVLSTGGYLQYERDVIKFKFTFLSEAKHQGETKNLGEITKLNEIAPNVGQRLHYWEYYAKNIVTSPQTFLIGHVEPPNRTKYPSAHNYYLDFIYNFGFLALFPMILTLVYTLTLLYRLRRVVYASPSLLSLSATVLFLVVIDNSLKVGLRQPYSGIFIFFLWGVLISKLSEIHSVRFDKLSSESSSEENVLKFSASSIS